MHAYDYSCLFFAPETHAGIDGEHYGRRHDRAVEGAAPPVEHARTQREGVIQQRPEVGGLVGLRQRGDVDRGGPGVAHDEGPHAGRQPRDERVDEARVHQHELNRGAPLSVERSRP